MKRLILALLVLSFFSFNAYASEDVAGSQNLKAACASTVDGPKRDIKQKFDSDSKPIETSVKDAVKGI